VFTRLIVFCASHISRLNRIDFLTYLLSRQQLHDFLCDKNYLQPTCFGKVVPENRRGLVSLGHGVGSYVSGQRLLQYRLLNADLVWSLRSTTTAATATADALVDCCPVYVSYHLLHFPDGIPELHAGRVDPRVGSGRVGLSITVLIKIKNRLLHFTLYTK